ncbi:MAG TPA: hypothetical protein VFZ61_12830, partial [Polyangiales bacterium]
MNKQNEKPKSFEYHPLPVGTVIRLKSMFPDLGALLLDGEARAAMEAEARDEKGERAEAEHAEHRG